ncbi:MAG TPA: DUF4157 domain-containing protein [Candidatus Limnocylindrales bacterium]|nr:DUF4157 domain-containing protein [Candidatus Limnocylindrales bacterium]
MRDFDLDPAKSPAHRRPDTVAPERSTTPNAAPGLRGGHHDAASLLHLQRTAGNAGVVQLLAEDEAVDTSPVHDVVGTGGGSPLDASTRADMEGRFGQSFADVRVHTDAKASQSAESVGANAYTVGSDIVFRSGQFDTASATGQRTLAHELTHVVQQRSGPVDGSEAPGGIRLSDPSDRFERAAESNAAAVMSGAAPASADAAATAQRQVEDEEPAIQTTLQRQAEEEEEEAMP